MKNINEWTMHYVYKHKIEVMNFYSLIVCLSKFLI